MVYTEDQNSIDIGTNKSKITIGTSDGHFFDIDLYKKKITIKHLLIGSKEFQIEQIGADNNEGRKLRLEEIDKAFEDLVKRDISLDDVRRINRIIYKLLIYNGEIDKTAGNFIDNIDNLLRNQYNEDFRQYDIFFIISMVFRNYWQFSLREKFAGQLNVKD